jgi:sortase A
MKTRLLIERILLLAGLFGVGIWAGSIGAKYAWQAWESHAFDREIKKQETAPHEAKTNPPNSTPSKNDTDGALVGRLSIPRLGVSAMVNEGTSADVLGVAVGHIPGTALPGHLGNVGLAGHRDTLFRGLRQIKTNDMIQFETLHGNYTYRVSSTEIVKPDNVKVLNAGASSELTLVTCYPFNYVGSAPDRFIVKATQVSEAPLEDPNPEILSAIEKPPVAEKPPKVRETAKHEPATKKIPFTITKDHSRQLAPGISLGVTGTDVRDHRVDGWMWLMPDRRTVWLRNQQAKQPVIFYSGPDGKKRELEITAVNQNSVTGFLVVPPE